VPRAVHELRTPHLVKRLQARAAVGAEAHGDGNVACIGAPPQAGSILTAPGLAAARQFNTPCIAVLVGCPVGCGDAWPARCWILDGGPSRERRGPVATDWHSPPPAVTDRAGDLIARSGRLFTLLARAFLYSAL
jgi:hypothetical protein